jgi:hypothetical protein
MELVKRVDRGGAMQGLPHAFEAPGFRMGILGKLRRAREREARIVIAPTEAVVHCRLCGSPHRARVNHLCPNLYGR